MPIYEYRCAECGAQKEILQRISDAPLIDCPACGKPAMKKMLSAAGFQLKGTGWYATDFKNNSTKPAAKAEKSGKSDTPAEGAKSGDASAKEASKTQSTPPPAKPATEKA